jgi:hypothetical protein
MSADIVIVPELGDEVWVAWQANQITTLAREHRAGTHQFKRREQHLYEALQEAFNLHLDTFHTWEWDDVLGGVVTIDRSTPYDHPYLGNVPLQDMTFESMTEAHQVLLSRALAETESILRRTA